MAVKVHTHPTCCGIIIFGNFWFNHDDDEEEFEAVEFLKSSSRWKGTLYELSLNEDQYINSPILIKYLNDEKNGWKLTAKFINNNSDNKVYVYHKLNSEE